MDSSLKLEDPGQAKAVTLNVFWAVVITCYGFVIAAIMAAF